MQTTKKNRMLIKQPDFSVSKVNQERATKLFDNFMNATKRNIEKNLQEFSTFSAIKRLVKGSKNDPTDAQILEVIKRLDRDKINSQIAIQISEFCQIKAQNLQKITLLKLIPFFIGSLAMIVLTALALTVKPLSISNPEIYKFILPMIFFLPLLIWGIIRRKSAKLDMISINVVLQGATAYASAKMQGKGQIGAMQNLDEMRRKAKSMDKKSKESKKEKNN
jgi:hypothetical protein